MKLDMPSLLSNPLLQSIYTEELRLRSATSLSRAPMNRSLKIGNYVFPKDKVILVSTWHEQRGRSVWNEDPVNGQLHYVEDFFAERFIVYPNDPSTGPRKPSSASTSSAKTSSTTDEKSDKPYYTTKSVEGSYIPYGGGLKICKGRFYAKQEALGSMALFLMMFDVELTVEGREYRSRI
jgi:cytochrome P450